MHNWISFVCGPKFTNFFSPTYKALQLIQFIFDFRYVEPFGRYSRSKSKVVKKRVEIWTFFWPSQNLWGGSSKSCTHIITPVSRHVVWNKFHEDTPTSLEVTGAHILNFMPNFKISPLKFFLGDPCPRWGCTR